MVWKMPLGCHHAALIMQCQASVHTCSAVLCQNIVIQNFCIHPVPCHRFQQSDAMALCWTLSYSLYFAVELWSICADLPRWTCLLLQRNVQDLITQDSSLDRDVGLNLIQLLGGSNDVYGAKRRRPSASSDDSNLSGRSAPSCYVQQHLFHSWQARPVVRFSQVI